VSLAGHALDIPLRDRILFGGGRIADLPAAVGAAGGRRAFIVTHPGVVRAGVAQRVRLLLEEAGIPAVDPAINNSPRLPDAAQVEAILRSVAG